MPSTTTREPYGDSPHLFTVSVYAWSDCGNFDHLHDPIVECSACGASLGLPEHEDEVDDFDAEVAIHESRACVARAIKAHADAIKARADAARAAADPEPF